MSICPGGARYIARTITVYHNNTVPTLSLAGASRFTMSIALKLPIIYPSRGGAISHTRGSARATGPTFIRRGVLSKESKRHSRITE